MRTFFFVIAVFFSTSLDARSCTERSGDIVQLALPATAFGFTLAKRDWPGSRQAAVTLITTIVTVQATKRMLYAERPNGGSVCDSFPSGHTAISFAAAGIMQKRYGWKYGAPYLALASYVGYTRLVSKAHWIQDILAGAAIGWLYSRLFVKPLPPKLTFYPELSTDSASLYAEYQF